MTLTIKHSLTLFISAVLFVAALIVGTNINFAGASAPSGLPSTVATSSSTWVSATASTIFATSSCAARIITTATSSVMLTFSDYAGHVPTGVYGHLQLGSTTVSYDSGLYGCGAVKAYSFTGQLLTLTESR